MDLKKLEELLAAFKGDQLEQSEAARRISELHFEDIGYARVDHSRSATRVSRSRIWRREDTRTGRRYSRAAG